MAASSGERPASGDLASAEHGFQLELVGEIANMVKRSAGPQSLGSIVERSSVKVVAGARNQRCLQALRARIPTVERPFTGARRPSAGTIMNGS
jgi:hypothetical protein